MSSHHIIREDQEPALLIMDPHAAPIERVQELLEWSPTVVVAEAALPDVLSWGIKVDVVIASASSIQVLTISLQDQFPLKLIPFQEDGEALSTALYFLIASKQKAVNIVSAADLKTYEQFSSLDMNVLRGNKRWSFIRSGNYEKWLPAGSIIQTYPYNDSIKTESEGVISIQKGEGFWVGEE